MAAFTKFNAFVEDLANGVHNFDGDSTATITVALTNAANAPTATDAVLTDLTVIAYTNLSSRVVSISASSQTSGTYKLVVDDLVLSASGGSVAAFQYVVLYNDAATNDELIGYYNYGSEVTLNDGDTFTIDFDGTNGLLQIA